MFHPSKLTRQLTKGASASLVAAMLCVSACGSSSMRTQDVASAQAAVRGAVEAGAERDPQAALHLKMARDAISQSRVAADHGSEDQAARMLARAEIDAELAIALARKADAEKRAREAQARLDSLEERE
jgi:hypothetical protein